MLTLTQSHGPDILGFEFLFLAKSHLLAVPYWFSVNALVWGCLDEVLDCLQEVSTPDDLHGTIFVSTLAAIIKDATGSKSTTFLSGKSPRLILARPLLHLRSISFTSLRPEILRQDPPILFFQLHPGPDIPNLPSLLTGPPLA